MPFGTPREMDPATVRGILSAKVSMLTPKQKVATSCSVFCFILYVINAIDGLTSSAFYYHIIFIIYP